jgi:hypothetical protein
MGRWINWGVALGVALGCRPGDATDTASVPLDQVVRLSPAVPESGAILTIASTIRNWGTTPLDLSSRICGLDTAGKLELSGSLLACAGFSRQVRLLPSDSVTAFDARVVTSPPGRYTLRVRHALEPERWVELSVVVK